MVQYIKTVISILFYRLIAMIVPKDDHSVVFGSWRGESFTDNSRYLAEYIGERYPEYRLYWVGKPEIRDEVMRSPARLHFLEMGRWKTNLRVMRCKYCFVSQKYHVDISKYNLLHHTVICYLHHGTPVKKWGDDGLNKRKARTKMEKFRDILKARSVCYTFYASSSPLNSEILCSAMKNCGCTIDKILKSGTPRNDLLINHHDQLPVSFRKKYFGLLGIHGEPKVIMYLPTYRRLEVDVFTFSDLTNPERRAIEKILEDNNAIIIEKSHFAASRHENAASRGRIFFADQKCNVQEMLLFTNILISDYSGAFLDFSLLDRPIIHFAYDYESYRDTDSGLYYEINEFNAGAICYSFEEMCNALDEELRDQDPFKDRRRQIRNKYMEYEQGKASELIFRSVIENGNNHTRNGGRS